MGLVTLVAFGWHDVAPATWVLHGAWTALAVGAPVVAFRRERARELPAPPAAGAAGLTDALAGG